MSQPTPQHPFKSRSFLHSLGYAVNGLKAVIQSERNFQTHIVMGVLVLGAGLFFRVDKLEWSVLVLCMAVMMAVEAMNTAVEYLVDMLSGDTYSEKAKLVKDIAAGACLLTAVGVAVAGLLIFVPHVLAFMSG